MLRVFFAKVFPLMKGFLPDKGSMKRRRDKSIYWCFIRKGASCENIVENMLIVKMNEESRRRESWEFLKPCGH